MAADQLTIRPCVPADAPALRRIFYDAVHTACAADYTPAQLDAWAPKDYDPAAWAETLFCRTVLAAERDGALLGFGSVNPCTEENYLSGRFTTWQGRSQAVIRAGEGGTLTVRVREGEHTEEIRWPLST